MKIIMWIFYLFTLNSCGASSGEEINEDQEVLPKEEKIILKNTPIPLETALDCKNGTSLNYENFGASFFSNYCNACHSAQIEEENRVETPIEMNFDNLQDIQLWRANILKSVIKEKNMPTDNDIPIDELAYLKEWLDCGAP